MSITQTHTRGRLHPVVTWRACCNCVSSTLPSLPASTEASYPPKCCNRERSTDSCSATSRMSTALSENDDDVAAAEVEEAAAAAAPSGVDNCCISSSTSYLSRRKRSMGVSPGRRISAGERSSCFLPSVEMRMSACSWLGALSSTHRQLATGRTPVPSACRRESDPRRRPCRRPARAHAKDNSARRLCLTALSL